MPLPAAPNHSPSHGNFVVWQDLRILFGLALAAAGLGAGINFLRAHPLPWMYASRAARLQQSIAHFSAKGAGTLTADTPPPSASAPVSADPAVTEVDLESFHALAQAAANLVLDARPALFYQVGHVPGARSLSRADFEHDYNALRPVLEAHRSGTLAVYCAGGDCEDSRLVADALHKLGYPHVVIYPGGWEEWRGAGLPEERR